MRPNAIPPSGSSATRASGTVPVAETEKRDALLGAICHDLRAPLAAVMMGANFVLQTTPTDEASGRSRRVLQAMIRSCKQMERLVRDFGDLSEIENDSVVLRPAVHDAGQMIEMAAEAARPAAEAKSVTIALSLPDEQVLLECDRDRVLRALGHVLDNAIRFAPDGSSVSLELAKEGTANGWVRFSVVDRGPGLSAETQANLYDRNWHSARADRAGAGLGLAIARGFVHAHGGSLEFTASPGPSTTFSLRLPKALPAAGSGVVTAAPGS
jgi:signal transduction histidine kinase